MLLGHAALMSIPILNPILIPHSTGMHDSLHARDGKTLPQAESAQPSMQGATGSTAGARLAPDGLAEEVAALGEGEALLCRLCRAAAAAPVDLPSPATACAAAGRCTNAC